MAGGNAPHIPPLKIKKMEELEQAVEKFKEQVDRILDQTEQTQKILNQSLSNFNTFVEQLKYDFKKIEERHD